MSLASKRWPSKFPLSGENPGGGTDTLWINMKVWKFEKQSLEARSIGGIQVSDKIDEIAFLIPMSFAENINHNWEEHQNVMSRAANAYKTITGHAKEAKAVADTVAGQGHNADGVSKNVVDTPLVFQGSNRREITFDILLADQGNIWNDVYMPVSLLRAYSSAATKGQTTGIEFPYLFEINTVDGYGAIIPLVTIKWAALRSIQPTFHGPYRDGIPSKCDLTLTFVDMEPLYKESFDISSSNKVTTSIKL